jgi:hypothetical protein
MKRLISTFAVLIATGLLMTLPAQADDAFGLKNLDLTFTGPDGTPQMQAGSHPFAVTNRLDFNTRVDPKLGEVPFEQAKDIVVELPEGLVGEPTATPHCTGADFVNAPEGRPSCADASAVGLVVTEIGIAPGERRTDQVPLYNLEPPPGVVQKLGFNVFGVPVTIEFTLAPDPPHNIIATVTSVSQAVRFFGSTLTVWGNPADPVHNIDRGSCAEPGSKTCPANIAARPFVTVPRACQGPLATNIRANSWQNPGFFFEETIFTHDDADPPNPIGFNGCAKLAFNPSIAAKPTTKAASSPTGLDFSLDIQDEGLTNPTGLAQSDIKEAVVTLPEGFSANPSIAEGLEVCSEADLDRESAFSDPGEGCPNASKVGTVEVETPLLEENVNGALFIAEPYENPFDSLLALYIVIKNPRLGIVVTQALEVIPDPVTGQLTTVAKDLPQLPFSHFRLHFREGTRSPLASPPGCGTYNAKATLTPWSGGSPVTTTSAFQIITGPDAGPCPKGGLPPLKPGLTAGTLNNAAGRFSPFYLRLHRSDSEQEITRFSIKLPPGITGKLAGIPYCPDAAITAAKARTGPHGGAEELASPSCPAASEIGRTLAGAGVGPSLAYAPGKVYLAGPYNGSNLSMVAITAGVVGPFDIGTVVVRQAFKIDPETAEVFIDATGSDPIPHIIRGVPVHLRDIRAYVDRPDFVLNPSDCTRTSTATTVLGSGLDFVSEADDNPITVSTPFQAADCAALPFEPKLSLQLKGGTKRGAHPAFKATLRMRGIGEAGIARAQVTLPRSEFVENAHFDTICTRVQFKAGAGNGAECPQGSIYGKAKAATPLLAEPLEGPVFLRSSENQLPDLVIALHNSQLDFNLVGKVDSVKGRLRNTFEAAPDAPVSSFTLEMKGGSKGLFINSTDLCKGTHRAIADFTGQNGKTHKARPALKVKCKKGRKGKGNGRRARGTRR